METEIFPFITRALNMTLMLLFISMTLDAQSDTSTIIHMEDIYKRLPSTGDRFVVGLEKESMRAILYAPEKKDNQTAHDQDEVYIIISGTGTFQKGQEKYPFKPNDIIFVPAKQDHRFLEFTKDFKTWVIFYGPRK